MGLISALKRLFASWFNINLSFKRFDDSGIQEALENYPKSLPEIYSTAIKDLADSIRRTYAAANNKEFTIGVIGDYTVGKSTFVNAILGSRFLPESVNPSTAIITKIKYGKTSSAVVRYTDGSEREMCYDEFMKYSAFSNEDFNERQATGRIKRFEDVVEAELYVKSDFLRENGLCIVDTLGLSASDSDNQKTVDSIRDAVVVIYLCSERGLTQNDKSFISNYLGHVMPDSFVCINRIDLVRPEERERLTEVVKLKLDDAIGRKDGDGFPAGRIYRVSSLYQEFANGFTEHKDWCEGVDYRSLSGFAPIMNDLGKYIGEKADTLRRKAINAQLFNAREMMTSLKEARTADIGIQITAILAEIETLGAERKRLEDQIAYIDSLFEGLKKTVYSCLPNFYHDFVEIVDERWSEVFTYKIQMTKFGVGDFISLKTDVAAAKLNVFVSDKDKLYADIDRLTRIVDPVKEFLQNALNEAISILNSKISRAIDDFATQNSFKKFFPQPETDIRMNVMEQDNSISNAMYRAAALAGTESTWMKNDTRKTVMFNAAKDEAVKLFEAVVSQYLQQIYQSSVLKYISKCNSRATASLNGKKNSCKSRLKKLGQERDKLEKYLTDETGYFDSIATRLDIQV